MLETTKQAIRAILAADSTVEKAEEAFWGRQLSRREPWKEETPAALPRRMTRAEVIDATGLSSATVSKLAARGVFVKIKAPGNKRGCGFTEQSVRDFLAGRETA